MRHPVYMFFCKMLTKCQLDFIVLQTLVHSKLASYSKGLREYKNVGALFNVTALQYLVLCNDLHL